MVVAYLHASILSWRTPQESRARVLVARPPPVFGSKWGAPTPLVARPETLRWWEVEVEDMFWCGVGLESAVGRGPLGRSSERGPIS